MADADSGVARVLRRFRPEEWLFLVFTVALVVLTIYAQAGYETLIRLLANWRFVGIVAAVCAVIFIRGYRTAGSAAELGPVGGPVVEVSPMRHGLATVGRTLREFSPLWACMIIYETLHDLTPILRPHTVDATLISIDHAVFGTDVSRWLNDHIGSPGLTEYLVICYASYGFATPIYAGFLYFKGHNRAFRNLSLGITITAFLGYIGYMTVPAIGPYMYQTALYADKLPQWGHNPLLDTINNLKGGARDCFPSLHTAMTTVLLTFMWRDYRRFFWGYMPLAAGLYLSTLYLRVHYAVDVAAGFVTATIAIFLAPRINRWWYSWREAPAQISVPAPTSPEPEPAADSLLHG